MNCERQCEWMLLNGRLSETDINEKSHPRDGFSGTNFNARVEEIRALMG
jgi:hypothetical protein